MNTAITLLNRAKVSCSNGGQLIENHFPASGNLVTRAQGGGSAQDDYKLSRYACYLIAQNGDPRKEQIASAQKYFAVKTREAEVVISKALEEIEILKLRVELVTMEREKAIADQKVLDTRHYITTALPKEWLQALPCKLSRFKRESLQSNVFSERWAWLTEVQATFICDK